MEQLKIRSLSSLNNQLPSKSFADSRETAMQLSITLLWKFEMRLKIINYHKVQLFLFEN